jgi:hypothetical protein
MHHSAPKNVGKQMSEYINSHSQWSSLKTLEAEFVMKVIGQFIGLRN